MADTTSKYPDARAQYDPDGKMADVPDTDFFRLVAEHPHALPGASKEPPIAPRPFAGLADALGPLGTAASVGAGAAQDVAQMGGLPYLAKFPKRVVSGAYDTLKGIGTTLAAPVGAAISLSRMTPFSGVVPYDPVQGLNEITQAGSSFMKAAPELARSLAQNAIEESTNPGAAFIRRPTQTTLDAAMIADLPSAVAGLVGHAAANAGMKGAAQAAMKFSEATAPAARNAALYRGFRDAADAVAPGSGAAIDAAAKRQTNIWQTREIVANRKKVEALQTEGVGPDLAHKYGRLDANERSVFHQIINTTAEPVNQQVVDGIAKAVPPRPELLDAIAAYRAAEADEQAALIRTGQLTASDAERRAWQPNRLAYGGEDQLARESAPRRTNDVTGLERRSAANTKLTAQAYQRAAKLADQEAEAARLRPALTQANTETRAAITNERDAAYYAGRSEQAQRGLQPIENMEPGPLRQQMVRQGTDVTKAEVAGEQAQLGAAASRAAIPDRPVDIAQDLGQTKAQLSESKRWQRVGDYRTAKAERDMALANEKRGRIPEIDRLDEQTQGLKQQLWDRPAEPRYFPVVPAKARGWARFVPPEFRAALPGYLKRSTGETYLSGEFEPDAIKALANHAHQIIRNQTNIGILQDVVESNLARPIKALRTPVEEGGIDWATEDLIAPGAYARGMIDKANELQMDVQRLGPKLALDKAASDAIISDQINAHAQFGEAGEGVGPFFAVPKHVGDELRGQLGGWYAGLPPAARFTNRLVFDAPNAFLRWTALTLRPGFYVNNLVGNTGMSLLAGATPKSMFAAVSGEAVPTAMRGGGFASVEIPAPGGNSILSKVGQLPKVLNEGVDELSRSSVALGRLDRAAMRKSIMENGARQDKLMSYAQKWDYVGPEGQQKIARGLSLYLNDYANQAPWQRNVLRNVLPFQSFLVHMTKFAVRLPIEAPIRAELLSRISELSNDYQDEQWKANGINPADLKDYRATLLPIGTLPNGKVETMGTAGFNPASGLGTSNADMANNPSVGGALRVLASSAWPGFQYGQQLLTGEGPTSKPFTKPGVYRKYGSDQPYDAAGQPTDKPGPSPWDYVRMNNQPIKMGEALVQPNETYDLTGTPFTSGYLPSGGATNSGTKSGPRAYNTADMAAGYMGVPVRAFDQSELAISPKEKADRARIAREADVTLSDKRQALKTATLVYKAAVQAQDYQEARKQQQAMAQLKADIGQIVKGKK